MHFLKAPIAASHSLPQITDVCQLVFEVVSTAVAFYMNVLDKDKYERLKSQQWVNKAFLGAAHLIQLWQGFLQFNVQFHFISWGQRKLSNVIITLGYLVAHCHLGSKKKKWSKSALLHREISEDR